MIECVAGRAIRGDRYFDFKDDYKGQITFFSLDVFDKLCAALKLHDCSPVAARRNVVTRGVDLNDLIGKEFEVQGVALYGTEECRPCYWMDRAFALGAHEFLKGCGGLRAKILTNGPVRSTAQLPLTRADKHLIALPLQRRGEDEGFVPRLTCVEDPSPQSSTFQKRKADSADRGNEL